MAILAMFEVDAATSSKYDEVIRRLTEIGQRVPDGKFTTSATGTGSAYK